MIARYLYSHPRILLLLVATIIVAGLTSFHLLPRLEDPVLGKRVGVISTACPGADTIQVESMVSIPVEQALRSVAEIKSIKSNSRSGISNVVIELQDRVTDTDSVWAKIQTRLDQIGGDLPELGGRQLVPRLEVFPLKAWAAIIAVKPTTEKTSPRSVARIARSLHDRLLGIAGTEKAELFGAVNEQINVEMDALGLSSIGGSVAQIAAQIRQQTGSAPGGRIASGDTELAVDTGDDRDPITQLKELWIRIGPRAESVKLSDIAEVSTSIDRSEELAIIDSEEAVVVSAMVDDHLRVDLWAEKVRDAVDEIAARHSESVTIETIFSQSDQIQQRLGGLWKNLAIGTIAVALVVLLLMGPGSAIVVSTALPLSGLLVITGLRAMDIPLHQMSVTGLIVALGLLIDNAIVIVEEINKRVRSGFATGEAITDAVRHLAVPLLGSTITTALAFLPIATLPGPAGEFVGTIAVSVILAITVSFLLSLSLIPAVFGWTRQRNRESVDDAGDREANQNSLPLAYSSFLQAVFRRPVFCLVPIAAVVLGCFWCIQRLPVQFFPASDRQQIQIEIEAASAATLSGLKESVDRAIGLVGKESSVSRQHWFLGRSAPTFFYNIVPRRKGTPFYAQAFLDLESGTDPKELARRIQRTLDDKLVRCRCLARQFQQGPPFDAPVEVLIGGPDIEVLRSLGDEVRLVMTQLPNVIHTRSDLQDSRPGFQLEFDTNKANQIGVSKSQVAGLLYTSLEGADAGSAFVDGVDVPIKVTLDLPPENPLDHVRALPLAAAATRPAGAAPRRPPGPSARPAATTISHIADFSLKSEPGGIIRIDGIRTNEVKAYIDAGVLPSKVIDQFRSRMEQADFRWPDGYTMTLGGEDQQRSRAVTNLVSNAILLFALMLLTLVASLRSFRCALIIAVIGATAACMAPIALYVFGFPLGFMAIVGTMGLVGVAINDSIVVLAAIQSDPLAKQGDVAQIAAAVYGCTRHVVATTLTTILGFTPLVIAAGRFWPPLAITIAGGVAGATLLALFCVPALYRLVQQSTPSDGRA